MSTIGQQPDDKPGRAQRSGPKRVRKSTANARVIAAAILAVVLTLFAVLNTQRSQVHLIFTTIHAPMIVVVVACGLIGLVLGLLIGQRVSARKKQRIRNTARRDAATTVDT